MRLVVVALALASAPAFAQNQPRAVPMLAPGETLLEIEATGRVKTRPDVVTFTAGIVTTGTSAEAALAENSRLTERLVATAAQAGIRGADIRTRDLSVEPRLSDDKRVEAGPRILGYVARNDLEVRFRDLAKAPALLSRLLVAGANSVRGPQFGLSSEETSVSQARADGVRRARSQAEDYARPLGLRVARVLRVSERARRTDPNGMIVVTGSLRPAPIEPGELETRVDLFVDFALVASSD